MTIEPFDAVLAEMDDPDFNGAWPAIKAWRDRLAAARAAEVEAAERDARRYRVLRSRAPDALNCLVSEWDFFGDAAEQLDAHFDAAIATTEVAHAPAL